MKATLVKFLRNAGDYNKTLAVLAVGVAGVLGTVAGVLADVLPAAVPAVVGAATVVTAVAVFSAKNQTLVDGIGDKLASLLDR